MDQSCSSKLQSSACAPFAASFYAKAAECTWTRHEVNSRIEDRIVETVLGAQLPTPPASVPDIGYIDGQWGDIAHVVRSNPAGRATVNHLVSYR